MGLPLKKKLWQPTRERIISPARRLIHPSRGFVFPKPNIIIRAPLVTSVLAFDAQSTSSSTANGVLTIDHGNMTVGAISSGVLLALLCWNGALPTSIVGLWDPVGVNQPLSLITGASQTRPTNLCSCQLYGLVAPTSGNKTLRFTWVGVRDVYIAAVSYSGVDQTGGATSFPNGTGANGSGTTATVTVTSAVGDAVVAAHVTNDVGITSVNNTTIFTNNTAAGISGGGNRAVGAATVAMTATWTGSGNWASVGTSVKAAAAASDTFYAIGQPALGTMSRRIRMIGY